MLLPGLALDGHHLQTNGSGASSASSASSANGKHHLRPQTYLSGAGLGEDKEEVLFADGEAFGAATGPGCFDDDVDADGSGSARSLQNSGGVGGCLLVVGSPVKLPPDTN
jgi:hypothetical protein